MRIIKRVLSFCIVLFMLSFSAFAEIESTTQSESELPTTNGYQYASISDFDLDRESAIIALKENENNLTEPTIRSLPSSCDNSSLFPAPYPSVQQGNTCVAWAVAYGAISGAEHAKWGWTGFGNSHIFSPAFLNNTLSNNSITPNFTSAINITKNYGVCPVSYMSANDPNIPNSRQNKMASKFKSQSMGTVSGLYAVKNQILNGKGILAAFVMTDTISSSYPVVDNNSTLSDVYAHAVCIVGYDDNLYGGAFKFINTWGNTWGQNGYGWYTYDAFNSASVNCEGAGIGRYVIQSTSQAYKTNMGDVNSDNSVTAADARLVLRYSANLETPTNEQFIRADVNCDGTVLSNDAQNILSYSGSVINEFPVFV